MSAGPRDQTLLFPPRGFLSIHLALSSLSFLEEAIPSEDVLLVSRGSIPAALTAPVWPLHCLPRALPNP